MAPSLALPRGGSSRDCELLAANGGGSEAELPPLPRLTPLWALKVVYCVGTGAGAALWKFITVFYHNVGLTNTQIGVVQLLNPVVVFVGQLLWAAVCDRLGSYKEVMVVSNALGTAVVMFLLARPIQQHFVLICIVVLAAAGLMSSRGSLVDSMALRIVQDYKEAKQLAERSGRPDLIRRLPSYGGQRLWAAAGWGGCSLLVGQIMDLWGVPFMFGSFAVLLTITVGIIITSFPSQPAEARRPAAARGAISADAETRSLWSFEVFWFFANLLAYGLVMSLVESFLFVFLLRDFTGVTHLLLGSSIAIMCAGEMPVFFYAHHLFAHLRLTTLLSVCHFVFAARCVVYCILPRAHPGILLLVEPVHGITFALMWVTAVEYGRRLSPPGKEATMQALLNGLYYQLAIGLGSLLWGITTEAKPRGLGFADSFLAAAAFIVLWSIVWNVGWCLKRRHSGHPLLSDVVPAAPAVAANDGGDEEEAS